MKKQRVRLSVRKAALFISIICTVGALAISASIVFRPATASVSLSEESVTTAESAVSLYSDLQQNTSVGQKTPAESPYAEKKESASPRSFEQTGAVIQQPAHKTPPVKTPSVATPAVKAVPVSGKKDIPQRTPPLLPEPVKPVVVPPPVQAAPPTHRGTLIVVFDDAGYNISQLRKFVELPFPVTVAVLPGLDYSEDAARMTREAGKEVILHQPMQAKNLSVDPGPMAVLPHMTAEEAAKTVTQNVRDLWPVSGLNNHEGSLITESEDFMDAVLGVCEREGIYFLDSRTTAQTVSAAVARKRGTRIWERSIFLDNTQERSDIEKAVRDGAELAEKKGSAVLIGHVWSKDLAGILLEMYPSLTEQGFEFSTISRMNRNQP